MKDSKKLIRRTNARQLREAILSKAHTMASHAAEIERKDRESCGCQLKRIGQDVVEKLDYQPGAFTV